MESITKLVNPEFNFEFAGKLYHLRKATLDKTIAFQEKFWEWENDKTRDFKLLSFCIYTMLRDSEPDITEKFVQENTPGDTDPIDMFVTLGFVSPSKLKIPVKSNPPEVKG